MINFKDPKDQTTSALAAVGLVAIVGSVIGLFLFHRYSTIPLVDAYKKELIDLNNRQKVAGTQLYDNTTWLDSYLWPEKEDIVTPEALALVSQKAEANHLKLVGFHPLKSNETDAVVQLPLQFTVSGPFASVSNMVDSFQKENTKLAVELIQFAALEGETDQVSASITVYAFLQKPVAKKAEKKSTARSSTSGRINGPVPQTDSNTSNK